MDTSTAHRLPGVLAVLFTCIVGVTLAASASTTGSRCLIQLSQVPLSLQGLPTLGTLKAGGQNATAAPGILAVATINCTGTPLVLQGTPAVAAFSRGFIGVNFKQIAGDGAQLVFQNANVSIDKSLFSWMRSTPMTLTFSASTVQFMDTKIVSNYAPNGTSLIRVQDGSHVIMDGVTFTSNKAADTPLVMVTGNSTLEITDSGLQNNVNSAASGGLLEAQDGGRLYVHNSTFTSNSAAQGGVLHGTNSSILRVEYCTFIANAARLAGGVLYLRNSSAMVDQSALLSNSAPLGGAIFYEDSLLTLRSSVLFQNTASQSGGGVFCVGSMPGGSTNLTTFDSNTAKLNGGAWYESECDVDIMVSEFKDNVASMNGSAIWRSNSPGLLTGVTFNLTNMAAARSLVWSSNSSAVDLTALSFVPPEMNKRATFNIS